MRRKGATYGKPFRKPVYGYSRENEKPMSATRREGTPNREEAPTEHIHKTRAIDTVVLYASAERTATETNGKSGTGRGVSSNAEPVDRKMEIQRTPLNAQTETISDEDEAPPMELAKAYKLFPARTDDGLSVFDMLSSEDEGETHKADMALTISNQRRIITSGKVKQHGKSDAKLNGVSDRHVGGVISSLKSPMLRRKRKLGTYLGRQHNSLALDDSTFYEPISTALNLETSSRIHEDCDSCVDSQRSKLLVEPSRFGNPLDSISPPRPTGSTLKYNRNRMDASAASNDLIPQQKSADTINEGAAGYTRQNPDNKPSSRKQTDHRRLLKNAPTVTRTVVNITKSPTRSESSSKESQTPVVSPRTPSDRDRRGSYHGARLLGVQAMLSPSPRQKDLWNQLLEGDAGPFSPSALPLSRLDFSSKSPEKSLGRGPGARRLVDSLKHKQVNDGTVLVAGDHHGYFSKRQNAQLSIQPLHPPLMDKHNRADSQATSSSQDAPTSSLTDSQPVSSQSTAAVQPVGPRLTYSRQRSFLSEASLDDQLLLQAPPEANINSGNFSCVKGPKRAAVTVLPLHPLAEEEDLADPVNAGTIRSIHELREAGGNKRFLDEFEGMLEDIGDHSASSSSNRRRNLLELATKLSKKPNARRFLDLNLDRRLFSSLGIEKDVLASHLFASIILILAREGLAIHSLVHACENGAFDMLDRLLPVDQDIVLIARDRRNNVSKAFQSLISDFEQIMKQLPNWTKAPDYLSPRTIALTTFEVMLRGLRDAGDVSHTLSPGLIHSITSTIAHHPVWSAQDRLSAQNLLEVETGLSVLETCTVSLGLAFDSGVQGAAWVLTVIEWLILVAHNSLRKFEQIRASVLRLVLNITNNKPSLCEIFGSPDTITALTQMISSEFCQQEEGLCDDDSVYSVDHLILALASMINLVESSINIRAQLLPLQTGGISLLDELLQPFLRGLERIANVRSRKYCLQNPSTDTL